MVLWRTIAKAKQNCCADLADSAQHCPFNLMEPSNKKADSGAVVVVMEGVFDFGHAGGSRFVSSGSSGSLSA